MEQKKYLAGLTLSEIEQLVSELAMPRFTARQITDWLYVKCVGSIDEMSNLSKKNRTLLSGLYEVGYVAPADVARSVDGTVKYLFMTESGRNIESVYIPDRDRATLCVSSQVGCKMNCRFCMTGKQGFNGQLTAREILNQIISIPERECLTNLVFMGMGEPFDNIGEVLKALSVLTSEWGFAWSPRRITVSSIGLIPGLKRFMEETDCHLAISLHSPYSEERHSLMPVEKAYPFGSLLELLRQYDFTKQRRLSFEYILFKGLNDSLKHAEELARRLRGMACRVNLIRFHAIPGVELSSSDEQAMVAFRDYLNDKQIVCTIRSSRGEDIFAACGMLSSVKRNENV